MYTCVDAISRYSATMWTVDRLGLPEGFPGRVTYALHVDDVMNSAGFSEEYVVDSTGRQVAYFSWCVSNDIHRKGDILDVTAVVIRPGVEAPGLHKFLAKRFKILAELNECQWVSRCVHEPDGSIRNIFKRI